MGCSGLCLWDQRTTVDVPPHRQIIAAMKPLLVLAVFCAAISAGAESPIRVNAPIHISGQVLDAETSRPVESYGIEWGWPPTIESSSIAWGGMFSSSSYSKGRFTVDFEWSTSQVVALRVLAPEYLPGEITTAPILAPARLDDVTVLLRRGRTLRGEVRTHSGEPASDIKVYLGGVRAFSVRDGQAEAFTGSRAVTGPDGRFELSGLGEASAHLVLSGGPINYWSAKLDDGQSSISIILPETGSLAAVYDVTGGTPTSSLKMNLQSFTSASMLPPMHEQTLTVENQSSATAHNLAPGEYRVARTKNVRVGDYSAGYSFDEREVKVVDGGLSQVDFVRRRGCAVSGVVTGLPASAAGAIVRIMETSATGTWSSDFDVRTFDVVATGSDGKFRTEQLEPGDYAVLAELHAPEPPGALRSGIRVPAASGLITFRVPETGTVPQLSVPLETLQPE